MYVYVNVCTYVCMYVYVYVCTYVCMHVCTVYVCVYFYVNAFVVIDALSVYLTGPSTPPGGRTSTDLSTSVNLYLESGEVKPPWVQVVTYLLFICIATHADMCHKILVVACRKYGSYYN